MKPKLSIRPAPSQPLLSPLLSFSPYPSSFTEQNTRFMT